MEKTYVCFHINREYWEFLLDIKKLKPDIITQYATHNAEEFFVEELVASVCRKFASSLEEFSRKSCDEWRIVPDRLKTILEALDLLKQTTPTKFDQIFKGVE